MDHIERKSTIHRIVIGSYLAYKRLRNDTPSHKERKAIKAEPEVLRAWTMKRIALRTALAVSVLTLLGTMPARAQELGHKTLGTLGMHAGSQPAPGFYVADRLVIYGADRIIDRNGQRIPLEIDIDAVANGVGIILTFKLPGSSTYFNASIGIPAAHVQLRTDRPEASIDRFGLGDLYVQPLKLGWKTDRLDFVSGYAFYAPTGRFTPGGRSGIGRGHWTHEMSAGGSVYFDPDRTWSLSALASYELNRRKRDIDITRGDTVQIQGGAGKAVSGIVEIGLAGYSLWQVRDDRGADLPAALRGALDRAFGLGPEINITVPRIRSRVFARYVRDIKVNARPSGQVLVLGLSVAAVR